MYSINTLARIDIGRQGETGLRKVAIDCTAWTAVYPGLGLVLAAIRPGETNVYLPTGVTVDSGVLTWVPDETDTAIVGTGVFGIQGTDASQNVIKSATAQYTIEDSIDGNSSYVPDPPEESWLAHAEAVLSDMLAQLAAQNAPTVTAWLEENITQETGYVLDTSLTVAGAAADAKAAGAVRDNLDGDIRCLTPQLVIPCNDMADSGDGSAVNGLVNKRGRILYVNGEYPGTNWRIDLFGRFDATNGSPSSVRVPSWYTYGACDQFVLGHTYRFEIRVLSGTAPEIPTEESSNVYVTCRTRTDDGDKYFAIRNGQTGVCAYVPEVVAITLPPGTYINTKLYIGLTDVTADRVAALEAAVAALTSRVAALE